MQHRVVPRPRRHRRVLPQDRADALEWAEGRRADGVGDRVVGGALRVEVEQVLVEEQPGRLELRDLLVPADPARAARLAQRIKVVVAQSLGKVVKDPRIESITITDARVTNDLQHATIYYTVFGDDEAKAAIAAIVAETGASSVKDMGRVMALVKERYPTAIEPARASGLVKSALS